MFVIFRMTTEYVEDIRQALQSAIQQRDGTYAHMQVLQDELLVLQKRQNQILCELEVCKKKGVNQIRHTSRLERLLTSLEKIKSE